MNLRPIALLFCLAITALAIGPMHAESLGLRVRDALAWLTDQGYHVVHSDNLVTSALQIAPQDDLSLPSVRTALREVGLDLRADGDHWLFVTHDRAPPAVVLVLTSSAGASLNDVSVTRGGAAAAATRDVGGMSSELDADAISMQPSIAGDPVRLLHRLPGKSSVGVSARPHVCGGLQDELLIRLDGVDLIAPFHFAELQSLISTVDDRSVQRIELNCAAFPARYGNRVSGVIEIDALGDDAAEPLTQIGVSTMAVQFNTRGESSHGDGAWLASARYGDVTGLANEVVATGGEPRLADGHLRISQQLGENARQFPTPALSRSIARASHRNR